MSARSGTATRRIVALAFAWASAAVVTPSRVLPAQPRPAAARLDTAALRRFTLGDLVDSTRVALAVASPPRAVHDKLADLTARLSRPESRAQRLVALGDQQAGFVTIARRRFVALTAEEAAALDTLAAIVEEELRDAVDARVDRTRGVALLSPVDAFNAGRRGRAMLDGREKLARFERKYGPDAPTRNGAEVALNFVAQFVPGLRANRDGWPSRAELIAAYVPTYLAVPRDGGKTSAVTAAEAGVRLYIWRDGWGGTRGGARRPGFVSFGLLAAGARDGAFVSPFTGQSRIGGFVGWGAAKIGVIGGRDTRVLITRQVQLVPWVF